MLFKDTASLRQSVMQDLQDLRDGRINNATARARAALTRTIIDTVSVEISAAQLGRHFDPVRLDRDDADCLRRVA
jgi:hypothetical protein